jgi:pimeloyl-ACP methyl ester carboxylesterase
VWPCSSPQAGAVFPLGANTPLVDHVTAGNRPFRDHEADTRVLEHYTFDERVHASAIAIDDYLATHRYRTVVLFGYSEGATIVGAIYAALKAKTEVKQLMIGANGGMSQYAQFKLLARSTLPMKPEYRTHLLELDAKVAEINATPNAIDRWWFGWPFRRWSTFLFYEPEGDLRSIDLPILCVHGSRDTHSPVESSRALAAAMQARGRTNFVYKEYDGLGHELSDVAFEEILQTLFP